jgi:hypothetical protein
MKLPIALPNRLMTLPVLLVLLLYAPAIGQTTDSDGLSMECMALAETRFLFSQTKLW